jgi:hypothetical protein
MGREGWGPMGCEGGVPWALRTCSMLSPSKKGWGPMGCEGGVPWALRTCSMLSPSKKEPLRDEVDPERLRPPERKALEMARSLRATHTQPTMSTTCHHQSNTRARTSWAFDDRLIDLLGFGHGGGGRGTGGGVRARDRVWVSVRWGSTWWRGA